VAKIFIVVPRNGVILKSRELALCEACHGELEARVWLIDAKRRATACDACGAGAKLPPHAPPPEINPTILNKDFWRK